MKKIFISIFIGCAAMSFAVCSCAQEKVNKSATSNTQTKVSKSSTSDTQTKVSKNMPAGAQALMKAYPNFVKGYKDGKLIMSDGSTIVYDDGKKKSFTEKLDNADPEDMFSIPYDRNCWTPGYLQDPGRIRCEQLFKKMYGASSSAVQSHLTTVKWFGQSVRFTTVNGAADALRKVAADIEKNPKLKAYVKSSGSFYWRKVRGANRQSAHSYGMTIDIAVAKSDYWQWSKRGATETTKGIVYKNKFPHELVEIFEKHGFIWGGRWYHYDTMHFEYRPELLVK